MEIRDSNSPRLIIDCKLGYKDKNAKNGVCENFIDCEEWDNCPHGD